jgi:hypothetical protein
MESWLFDVVGIGIAILAMVLVILRLAFSGSEEARREAAAKRYRGFERRDAERLDRRRRDQGPPPETPERRSGSRR